MPFDLPDGRAPEESDPPVAARANVGGMAAGSYGVLPGNAGNSPRFQPANATESRARATRIKIDSERTGPGPAFGKFIRAGGATVRAARCGPFSRLDERSDRFPIRQRNYAAVRLRP